METAPLLGLWVAVIYRVLTGRLWTRIAAAVIMVAGTALMAGLMWGTAYLLRGRSYARYRATYGRATEALEQQ